VGTDEPIGMAPTGRACACLPEGTIAVQAHPDSDFRRVWTPTFGGAYKRIRREAAWPHFARQ